MPEPKKVKVDPESCTRLLHPRHTVLVTCADKTGKANIVTLAWSMPTSHKPPMVAISIAPGKLSHRMIEETGEFVVNVPTMDIVKETLLCGRTSGSKFDKFKETHLTRQPSKNVGAPMIKECVAHLECKLAEKVVTGDHTLFIGEVIAARVNEGVFVDETFDIRKVKPVYHIGGDDFATLTRRVVTPRVPKRLRKR